VLLNYHIGRFVLGSLCVGDLVRLGLSSVRVAGFNLRFVAPGFEWCLCPCCRLQPAARTRTQRTENKTTNVVIQQHSRELLMMDILMSETC